MWRDRGRRSASAGGAWHEECLKCAESGQPPSAGQAYLHEGRPVNPEARVSAAPRCHSCGEPAVVGRIFAHGCVYHSECFRCVHCKHVIGERKFVVFDGEPYWRGATRSCSARPPERRCVRRSTEPSSATPSPCPLLLWAGALQALQEKHEELLPQVRRLREAGIVQFASFLFQPPLVSKPSMVLHMLIPASLDAEHALPSLLQEDRIGQQWMELHAAHDTAAARGNPCGRTYSRSRALETNATDEGELTEIERASLL